MGARNPFELLTDEADIACQEGCDNELDLIERLTNALTVQTEKLLSISLTIADINLGVRTRHSAINKIRKLSAESYNLKEAS
jgi:hypothetical protein